MKIRVCIYLFFFWITPGDGAKRKAGFIIINIISPRFFDISESFTPDRQDAIGTYKSGRKFRLRALRDSSFFDFPAFVSRFRRIDYTLKRSTIMGTRFRQYCVTTRKLRQTEFYR